MHDQTIQFFSEWPELSPYSDRICLVEEIDFMSNSAEDIISIIQPAINADKLVIFNRSTESLGLHSLNKAQLLCDKISDLPPNRVFFVTGAVTGAEDYDKFIEGTAVYRMIILTLATGQLLHFRDSFDFSVIQPILNKEYQIRIKEKKFLCFNKVHKGHRAYILARMLENGLFDQSYFSFEGNFPGWINQIQYGYDWAPVIKEQLTKHIGKFPIRLNITPERANPVQMHIDDVEYHANSYFSLITETIFYQDRNLPRMSFYDNVGGVFFTEKTARPLLLKHPFILAGYVNSLAYLRTMGFKTFHPYIDETYDTESDDDRRLDMIVAETERLCKFTDQEWLDWQASVKEIVEYNYRTLFGMKSCHGMDNVAALVFKSEQGSPT